MPPKCKSNKVAGSSQLVTADDADEPSHTKRQRADQLFNSEPVPLTDSQPNGSQPWHSSRSRKGSGGQLQQLLNLEHLQTTEYLWPSTQNLDIATQGQAVNPMAPGHRNDDKESQIPLWASQLILDFHIQPSFTASQPSQLFSFRIPLQSTAGSTGGTQSFKLHSSCLSSHSSSIFTAATSHRGSSVLTSHLPSECGSNDPCGT
ncbi:hypothetical protein BKA83DRAFT_4485056 [Pisolithus microcarpus]|nr:hypothetical protein BKA83DRAFT_4485056 [Pisolithus microcarpus]